MMTLSFSTSDSDSEPDTEDPVDAVRPVYQMVVQRNLHQHRGGHSATKESGVHGIAVRTPGCVVGLHPMA